MIHSDDEYYTDSSDPPQNQMVVDWPDSDNPHDAARDALEKHNEDKEWLSILQTQRLALANAEDAYDFEANGGQMQCIDSEGEECDDAYTDYISTVEVLKNNVAIAERTRDAVIAKKQALELIVDLQYLKRNDGMQTYELGYTNFLSESPLSFKWYDANVIFIVLWRNRHTLPAILNIPNNNPILRFRLQKSSGPMQMQHETDFPFELQIFSLANGIETPLLNNYAFSLNGPRKPRSICGKTYMY